MTGGMLPLGADTVVMVELTEEKRGEMEILEDDPRIHVCLKGEDIKEGQAVLDKGSLIRPQEVAVLASIGVSRVPVYKQPVVGVIATGSELVEPGRKRKSMQIRNSNSYQLCSQVERIKCKYIYYGIVKDKPELIDSAIKRALKGSDIILLSGGVSMGDYDFVPELLKANGIKLKFESVAIKPGKPTVFGYKGYKFFFGMPGNPVSTFVIFELFVKPFLYSIMGHEFSQPKLRLKLKDTLIATGTGRTCYVPVKVYSGGYAGKISYHGSAHIHSLCSAGGLVKIKKGVKQLKKGSYADVILIDL